MSVPGFYAWLRKVVYRFEQPKGDWDQGYQQAYEEILDEFEAQVYPEEY